MIEKEFKLMLDEDEYEAMRLISETQKHKIHVQTNYYFDTKTYYFFKNNITLRIREKSEEYELTFKVKNVKYSDCIITINKEYNYKLDKNEFLRIKDGCVTLIDMKPALTQLPKSLVDQLNTVKYLGKLMTERITFKPWVSGPFVELDQNYYFDYIDWELECEINSVDEYQLFKKWIVDRNINVVPSKDSKYQRFIDRYKLNI